jgi:hypothetical protein
MEILQKRANGMRMMDIMKSTTITQWIEGFVDDTSIYSNTVFQSNNIKDLKDKLRYDGQYWAGLLEASGGKLELVKCFYYILKWTYDKRGNPRAETISEQQDNNNPICLQVNNDIVGPLIQKDINESHKTLGALKRITGKEIEHETALTQKSDYYADIVCNNKLDRRKARLAYNSCYIPALSYSLTSVSFNEPILNRIQQNAIAQFIRKLGFKKCFPRAAVYGPTIF